MKPLRLSNNGAAFRIHLASWLILLGAILVSACTASNPSSQSGPQSPRYQLVPAPLDATPPPPQASPPLRLLAAGSGRARIVDAQGDTVRAAAPELTILGLQMSPGRHWALLYFGSAKYAIASADDLEDIARPPVSPDGFDDATGFSWFILDEDHLIGQADLPSLETAGLTASEQDALPPRDTLIYVFNIPSGVMSPVEIDGRLSRPFHITDALDGQLTLLHYTTSETMGARIQQLPEP